MKLLRLAAADVRFQWHYGFYAVYAIFVLLYVFAVFIVPQESRRTVAAALIYSDPAAMGLFFMGAMVLLEKSQRTNFALRVSPVSTQSYIAAKAISLTLIGILVSTIIALSAGVANLLLCIMGIFLAGILYSLIGLSLAMCSNTLNRFVIFAIPAELILVVPPAVLLFGIESPFFVVHPGFAAVYLIYGEGASPLVCAAVLIAYIVLAFVICCRIVKKKFLEVGGSEL